MKITGSLHSIALRISPLASAAFEGVAPPIGLLRLITDAVRQRLLGELTRIVGLIASPVTERTTETVTRHVLNTQPLHQLLECHVGKGPTGLLPREDETTVAALYVATTATTAKTAIATNPVTGCRRAAPTTTGAAVATSTRAGYYAGSTAAAAAA